MYNLTTFGTGNATSDEASTEEASPLPGGTVTLLFTDMVASSRIKCLLEGTESEKNAEWMKRFQEPHHRLVRQCLAEQRGFEVKTMGDAFFATFDDPANAVRCAVQIQRRLVAARLSTPLPDETPLMVRIGVHTGQARRLQQDYIGTSVDKAARIGAAAAGGQVLLSEQTAALVREQFPEWRFRSSGYVDLHGLGKHDLVEVLWETDAAGASPVEKIGGFELRGRIGAGGMGVVYRAWQPSEEREVALKCLHLGDAAARLRFLNEIRALGQVEHPHLVRIYSSGAEQRHSYYAMELIDGANFKSLYHHLQDTSGSALTDDTWRLVLKQAANETRAHEQPLVQTVTDDIRQQAQPLAPIDYSEMAPTGVCQSQCYIRQVVSIVRQVSLAAHALHDKGVIHRDIKPENIMLTRDGDRAVLMDLGIAKFTSDAGMTRTREFIGSLRYSSPEQVLDARQVDHRSDIYSLGATLWEMLTLRPIYNIDDNVRDSQAMLKIEVEEPAPVRRFNRAVSVDLQAIVQKCLEKDPPSRYATAADLAEELERYLEGRPVLARPVGPFTRIARRCKRRPLVPGLLVALAFMAVVLSALLIRWPTTRLRLGLKPWVGFAPLAVAAELGLCKGIQVDFLRAENIETARTLLAQGKIDAGLWLVDSHVHTRSRGIPTKVVLKLDTSLGADALVATRDIRSFEDLRGKRIAYEFLDAPHFLFLTMCDVHGIKPGEFKLVRRSAKQAAQDFIDSADKPAHERAVDAAVTYDPFLQATLEKGHVLATSGDLALRGSIVDILTIDETYLANYPGNVKALIAGWFEAVACLERGDPEAVSIACKFLGKPGQPIHPLDYHKMAQGMKYATAQDNLDFFRVNAQGSSAFRDLMSAAQDRWDRFQQLGRTTDPKDGDGSDILFQMFQK